jgi:multicomponent K+:H+ antiporter subunit A
VIGAEAEVYITHWHGFVPALWLSMIAVGGGLVLLGVHGRLDMIWLALPRPEAKAIFDGIVNPLARAARVVTDRLHDGSFARYAAIAVVAILAVGFYAYASGTHAPGTRSLTPIHAVPFVGWVLLMGATASLFTFHRNRLLALVLVGVIGLMVSVGFVYLSAPDLALTQISVEVATVMLLLLALNFLPKESPVESSAARRGRDGLIAGATGIGVGALIYAIMMRDFAFPTIAEFHLANSKPGGGGTNAVNVILVDFRGYDTFGEIVVLGIAGLVIYALVEALLRGGAANDRLLAWVPDQKRAGDRHPLMLVVATRMILPIAIMVGVYIFLRGHNEPGGGFIAGLVVAIATVMQYMASGYGWAAARQRIDYHAMIGWGVTIAGLCGVGSWFVARPFMTTNFGYFKLPFIEKFELATAAIFDLGVFLTVVGAVMLALASISRIAIRAGETVNVTPFDVQPDEQPTTGGAR